MRVTIVNACLREGGGGSPTADVAETALSDDQRRRVPRLAGTSHAAFISVQAGTPHQPQVVMRFFTREGELPGCGHGTVAALAFLADRAGAKEYEAFVHTPGGSFSGRAVRQGDGTLATSFDAGPVELREATTAERRLVLPALGAPPDTIEPGTCVGSPGRPRLLVPISTRSALMALRPDLPRLAEACNQLNLLGCYVHTLPTSRGRIAARMLAPSIGVPEDVANANSTACLAAYLARRGLTEITVDMGDSLGRRATVIATTDHAAPGRIRVGGTAVVARIVRLAE